MSGENGNAETSLAPMRVPLLPEAAVLLERSHVNVLGAKVESFNDVVRHARGDLLMIVKGLAVSNSIKERAREDPVGLDEWFEAHPYHESDDVEKDSAVRLAVCYLHRLAIICTMKEIGDMEQVAVELYSLGRAIQVRGLPVAGDFSFHPRPHVAGSAVAQGDGAGQRPHSG